MAEFLTDPEVITALFTLIGLEIILGIDNIIFISILVGDLTDRPDRYGVLGRFGYYSGGFGRPPLHHGDRDPSIHGGDVTTIRSDKCFRGEQPYIQIVGASLSDLNRGCAGRRRIRFSYPKGIHLFHNGLFYLRGISQYVAKAIFRLEIHQAQ